MAQEGNEQLRISLLLGDITEPQFDASVCAQYRRRRFKADMGRVVETFTLAGLDVFLRVVREDLNHTHLLELRQLRALFNEEAFWVGQEHGRSYPRLTPSWEWKIPYAK